MGRRAVFIVQPSEFFLQNVVLYFAEQTIQFLNFNNLSARRDRKWANVCILGGINLSWDHMMREKSGS